MNPEEVLEWLDHTAEWAHELNVEATGYAETAAAAGQLSALENEFVAVAALAKDLRERLAAAFETAEGSA